MMHPTLKMKRVPCAPDVGYPMSINDGFVRCGVSLAEADLVRFDEVDEEIRAFLT